MRKFFATAFVFLLCLAQLSGCGVHDGRYASNIDGAPDVDINPAKIRNAVPKSLPYHPYGRKSYVVGGKRYRVLKNHKGYNRKGHASWYGTKFHGRETSTQDRFNMFGMTAASRDLPIPCYAEVTNLRNGRKIIVKVNDRGPFHSRRIIDLSYAAAKKLGFAEQGTAPVRVVAIDSKAWCKNITKKKVRYASSKPKTKKKVVMAKKEIKPKESLTKSKLFLQVGAFSKLDNAKQLSDKVVEIAKKPVQIEQKANLYRVHVGPLASSSQRDELKILLKKNGFDQVTLIDG